MAKQEQPNRDHSIGGWVKQMEDDGYYYSGRRRTSGLDQDHDAAGGLDSLINPSVHVGAVAVAEPPSLCSSCDALVNPLTLGCRC